MDRARLGCARGFQSHVICSCKPFDMVPTPRPLPPVSVVDALVAAKTKKTCPEAGQ